MRTFLYIFSARFFFNSIVLVARRSFTLGLVMMFGIAIALFILARYWNFWCEVTASGRGMYLKYLVMMGVFCFMGMAAYVLSYAHTTVDYKENVVIVLGCGLNSDGTPSPTLQNRLDGCLDYYEKNPYCYVVVSGGYSRFHNATEGSAMKKYLVDNGIPADRILTDEKATSTKENFEYAMELLNDAGISTEKAAFVTNSFHIYRAEAYARQMGFTGIKAISVKTDPAVFVPAVIREVCAVVVQLFFKY